MFPEVAALPARGVAVDLRWYRSLPSTMDVAASLAEAGAVHGVVVLAEEQTAGRGRRGNIWVSPPAAGLYFSFVAKPSASSSLITLAAGVGVREGILAATGLDASLKWPNDLLVDGRKLAGILAEGHAVGTAAQFVVIGVGVNVTLASYPAEIDARATSLERELGTPLNRGAVLAEVLSSLWTRLDTLERSPGDILQAWRAASPSATGTTVQFDGRTGVTAGIDGSGALLVRMGDRTERVISGELQWHLTP